MVKGAEVERGRKRGMPTRGRRRRARARPWTAWTRAGAEVVALAAVGVIGTLALLGRAAGWLEDAGLATRLAAFAITVLGVGAAVASLAAAWMRMRPRLAAWFSGAPLAVALALAAAAGWLATGPSFQRDLAGLQAWIGGSREARRLALAHQVYAAYRRADVAQLAVVLERARVYEATVLEAAATYGVDAEILMGVGCAESSFYPRDSADGGRGLFQITAPPAAVVAEVRRRLGAERLDPLNQRHNAHLAAATLRAYLHEMRGDTFLGLLAYNIGPRNGGLRSVMRQYGARDFVTIQPYLQHLPRDYPIRVLTGALAYRLWRTEGRLPRYEEGDNARRIQRHGIPGLAVG